MLLSSCARRPRVTRCGSGSLAGPSLRPPRWLASGSKVPGAGRLRTRWPRRWGGGARGWRGGDLRTARPARRAPAGAHAGVGGQRALRCGGPAAAGRAGRACAHARRGAGPGRGRAGSAAPTCTAPTASSPPKAPGVVPGHEVVGEVGRPGPGVSRFGVGDRVGVAWLRSTCGRVPVVPSRRGEPVPAVDLHRLGRRRRVRRVRRRTRGLRLPDAGGADRRARPRRCCARASSATAPCAVRSCRREGGSASTASGPAPTSPPRSRSPRGRRCTC